MKNTNLLNPFILVRFVPSLVGKGEVKNVNVQSKKLRDEGDNGQQKETKERGDGNRRRSRERDDGQQKETTVNRKKRRSTERDGGQQK